MTNNRSRKKLVPDLIEVAKLHLSKMSNPFLCDILCFHCQIFQHCSKLFSDHLNSGQLWEKTDSGSSYQVGYFNVWKELDFYQMNQINKYKQFVQVENDNQSKTHFHLAKKRVL